ncbi:MAG: prepilin-type N-terminal cleavage/methylation domain-containing protein [Synergistales bacterium]|nr:prepilin-type N-terminal cleavage/methylation domain-containing protein [Synergistales bacterium]MDY6400928.1 prepilin-type N-terminal cleavage/methylation domain-containing protein [Synergistales bacterium]MDY6405366.1 prepilin-type N-terminal cleavage/methylation domain-containing protein [Synergistales bacterium]MDY6410706.1 prepilin-type N-terminal cleavage/methylation domain-containing protein [Synergistales bacterium]MDY6413735.1 prepilin-type N-terminal cleavage/methylation domain-con
MRHSRGFTLVELMTAMAVYGIFLAMLSGAFYALLTFGSRSQKVLVAREHGRRVIEYVDSRIRNAGLGLHALKTSKEVRDAMKTLTWNVSPKGAGPFYPSNNMRLPIAISSKYSSFFNKNEHFNIAPQNISDDIQSGNILTLLYADRETDDGDKYKGAVSLIIVPQNASGDVESRDVKTNDTVTVKFLVRNSLNQYEKTFGKNVKNDLDIDIRNWAVLRGSGVPVKVTKSSEHKYKLNLETIFDSSVPLSSFNLYAGDELLYLRCERIFAEDPRDSDKKVGEAVRNLKVQKLEGTSWGQVNPTETGILEIYAELNTRTNIFTLWVLSTGGKDSIVHERSTLKDWPRTARWQDNYEYETLYVSKASWKIHNVCEGFDWSK